MILELFFLTYLTTYIHAKKLLNTMLIYQFDFYLNEKTIVLETEHTILA